MIGLILVGAHAISLASPRVRGEIMIFAIASQPNAITPYRLMRADAGWPGTLKCLPVSVTLVPSTFRIEKS
jgi:hypothetical protein